jgi:hypothetical protein
VPTIFAADKGGHAALCPPLSVIASEAKQSMGPRNVIWIASLRSQ